MSLKQQFITSIKWASLAQFSRQVLQLLTAVILARLLPAADFGLVSMATVLVVFVNLFNDLGTSAAIVQRAQINPRLLSSAFWLNAAIGLLSTLLLLAIAPVAASFYNEPRVAPVIQAFSAIFLIASLKAVPQTLMSRNLQFRELALLETSSAVIGAIVALVMAASGAGVWSLVAQTLLGEGIKLLLTWGFCRWKPLLVFDWQELKSISRYGLSLTAYSIVDYFHLNADYLLIGKFLGAESLGYYYLAYRLISFLPQNISAIVSRVLFPTLAQMQEDDAKFRFAYLRVVKMIALIACPLMLGLMVLSQPFVQAVLGRQWEPIAPLLMILAPIGLSKSISATTGPIYQAKGKTDVLLYWGLIVTAITLAAFVIGLRWGVVGVAVAYTSTLPLAYPSYQIAFRFIHLSMREFGRALRSPFLGCLLMVAAILAVWWILPTTLASVWVLVALTLVGSVAYALAIWWIDRESLRQVFTLLRAKSV